MCPGSLAGVFLPAPNKKRGLQLRLQFGVNPKSFLLTEQGVPGGSGTPRESVVTVEVLIETSGSDRKKDKMQDMCSAWV